MPSPYYDKIEAEVWFADEESAEKADFLRWDVRKGAPDGGSSGVAKFASDAAAAKIASADDLPPVRNGRGSFRPVPTVLVRPAGRSRATKTRCCTTPSTAPGTARRSPRCGSTTRPAIWAAGFTRWDEKRGANVAAIADVPAGPYGKGSASADADGSGSGWLADQGQCRFDALSRHRQTYEVTIAEAVVLRRGPPRQPVSTIGTRTSGSHFDLKKVGGRCRVGRSIRFASPFSFRKYRLGDRVKGLQMRIVNLLSAGLASFAVASLTLAAPHQLPQPTSAGRARLIQRDSAFRPRHKDKTGSRREPMAQQVYRRTFPPTHAGEGYELDQDGSCVSTSAPTEDAPATDAFSMFPGSQGSPGPGDVNWLPGFGESSCPGGCE